MNKTEYKKLRHTLDESRGIIGKGGFDTTWTCPCGHIEWTYEGIKEQRILESQVPGLTKRKCKECGKEMSASPFNALVSKEHPFRKN